LIAVLPTLVLFETLVICVSQYECKLITMCLLHTNFIQYIYAYKLIIALRQNIYIARNILVCFILFTTLIR